MENFTLRSSIDKQYLTEIKALATQMANLGMIATAPDVDALVDIEFLPAG